MFMDIISAEVTKTAEEEGKYGWCSNVFSVYSAPSVLKAFGLNSAP
jgi:hypothetical protein